MPKITRYIFLTSLFVFIYHISFAQTSIHQQIVEEYDTARNKAPREKLYIHFDKTVYATQDTLWFKAYLVGTTLNAHSPISGLIYTELIDSNGEVINTLALPTAFGLTWGSFALKETRFPPGNYMFRAYTKWMQNFGDTYIFKREIKIVDNAVTALNPHQSAASKASLTKKKASPKLVARSIDIQFLPEGGTWLSGTNQMMGFKALNSRGKGIEISGEILDIKQQKIAEFKSNGHGMGHFNMVPIDGERYVARIKFEDTNVDQVLPASKPLGTALQVDIEKDADSIRITLVSTLSDQNLMVIGQSKGILCFTASIRPNIQRKVFKVAKSVFATGVCQILVVDERKQILNERNFFLNFDDQLRISTTTDAGHYGNRDSIPVQIKVRDASGKPITGSFSMAITDDAQVLKNKLTDANILTYLLLTSDLKGEIENPGQYFDLENPNAKADLDDLMRTQGWVRYEWPKDKQPLIKAEKAYTISGRVTNIMNKPSEAAKILLLGTNKTILLLDTTTNQNGEFVFDKLPQLDSASMVIQARNVKGKKGTLGITLNEFVRPPISLLDSKVDIESSPALDSTISNFIATKNQAEEAALKNGIILREVKIMGKRTIKNSKNLNGPGEASQILTETELEPLAKKTLYDVLVSKIKGFRSGNRKKSADQDFFINGDLARFVIDGVELDYFYQPMGSPNEYYHYIRGYLDYYSAEDVKGVETMENGLSFRYKSEFKHPMDENTYAFVEITTKTGSGPFLKKSANMYLLKPINYGDHKVFYHPRYTSANIKNTFPDYRSTLYWNPNILTDEEGNANVSFFSADKKGTYTLWIEGTDTQGGLGMHTMKIEIK